MYLCSIPDQYAASHSSLPVLIPGIIPATNIPADDGKFCRLGFLSPTIVSEGCGLLGILKLFVNYIAIFIPARYLHNVITWYYLMGCMAQAHYLVVISTTWLTSFFVCYYSYLSIMKVS